MIAPNPAYRPGPPSGPRRRERPPGCVAFCLVGGVIAALLWCGLLYVADRIVGLLPADPPPTPPPPAEAPR